MEDSFFNQITENFRNRLANPFLGTYLFVWLFRNWSLVYSLFNFEPYHTLDYKLNYIEEYLINKSIIWELLINALITILLLIFSYLMINLVRVIIILSENRLKLIIIKKWDNKRIKTIEEFNNLLKKYEDLKLNYERIQEDYNNTQKTIQDKNKILIYLENSIDDLNISLKEMEVEEDNIVNEKIDYFESSSLKKQVMQISLAIYQKNFGALINFRNTLIDDMQSQSLIYELDKNSTNNNYRLKRIGKLVLLNLITRHFRLNN